MAQREGSIYLYLFIASFILFAGMVVVFFVQKADHDELFTTFQSYVRGVEENKWEPLNGVLARDRQKLEQLNSLKQLIGGPDAATNWPGDGEFRNKLKEITEKYNEIGEKLQQPKRDYVAMAEPYEDLLNLLNALKRAWDEANERAKAANDQYSQLRETTEKQLAEFDKKLAEKNQAQADLEKRCEEESQKNKQKIEEMTQLLDKKEEEYTERELTSKREIARLNNTIQQRDLTIKKLQEGIVRDRNIEDIEPDGQILQVEPLSQLAWVNRGRKDHMRLGTEFRIFQYVGGKKVFKGKGEISRVEEDISLLRITKEDDELNPISVNDQVTSPFYDPKSTPIFVFAGEKLNDPNYDMGYVKRRLEASGAEVRKEVSHDTDFVVAIKGFETSPQYKAAREFNVTILRESDLLEYLGR
ncbi:MAG: hypothetical protein HY717_22240 [Planctomycetes bacterium]|nr:hypothetical protein [Planctomycetota bacterium]